MANPLKKGTDLIGANYQVTTVLYESPLVSVTYSEETAPFYCITADYCLMEKQRGEQSDWKDMGELGRPVFLTKQELLAMYVLPQEEVKNLLDGVSVVYRVDTDDRNQRFYLVMQTRTGEVLIAVGYGHGEQEDVRWLFATEKVSVAWI
ncbi:MAG: hypothetical protein J6B06_07765 [Lachnospiraceae bacterium]|nr:hypothetical protein [Lachnospiraceae bacterium]